MRPGLNNPRLILFALMDPPTTQPKIVAQVEPYLTNSLSS
jgi:hypothetical protein